MRPRGRGAPTQRPHRLGQVGGLQSDGKLIVTASWDRTARIWDAATGQQCASSAATPTAVNSAAYSPDGKFIVTASEDRTARIWDAATGQECASLSGHTAGSTRRRTVPTASSSSPPVPTRPPASGYASIDDLLAEGATSHPARSAAVDAGGAAAIWVGVGRQQGRLPPPKTQGAHP